jgi:ABC-type nickel/cobalt efflux system permease component RcnA
MGATYADAGDNPFVTQKHEKRVQNKLHYPVFVQKFIARISALQKTLNRKITELGHRIKTGSDPKPMIILVLVAFVYGVVHSMGPGHGKVVAFSYFLTERETADKSILFGAMIAFGQALSAILTVAIIYFAVRQTFLSSFESFSRIIKLLSASLIVVLGSVLIGNAIFTKTKAHGHHNSDDGSASNKKLYAVALSVGIVPCPGAVILLLFTINMGIFFIGIPITLVMALGMTVTISAAGSLSVAAKNSIRKAASSRLRLQSFLYSGMKIAGAFFIVFVGALLLIGNL